MIKVLSVENMRKSDAHTIETKISGKELMFLAGEAIYENVSWKPPVAIVCGSGNNAGDGYVVAQLLKEASIACTIFQTSTKTTQDSQYYLDICKEIKTNIIDISSLSKNTNINFSGYNTILDCIFGTGFKGDVQGVAKVAIESINKSNAYIVSVDINSGLNGDNGLSNLCVKSDLTISIGDFKSGHFLNMAKDVMKTKINCNIGIEPVNEPFWLLEHDDLKKIIKPRCNYSNKGSFGYIALVGGSKKYCGAIKLAAIANAAMRSGAGVVKIAIPASLYNAVAPQVLESTLFPLTDTNGEAVFVKEELDELIKGVRTIAFGMGIGVTEQTSKMLHYIIKTYTGTLIIDADGLTILAQLLKNDPSTLHNAGCNIVLTPHAKEFARLLDCEISTYMVNPIEVAMKFAKENNVIVLLKGPTTIITDGNKTYLTDAGCAGMATAGSGDVLSGILAAICSWAVSGEVALENLLFAVAAGAYINGKAGELAQKASNSISMTAGDTANEVKNVIRNYAL